VRVVDAAGNVGATGSQDVVIDTASPSPATTIDITAIADDSGASTTDFNTSDSTLVFSGTLGAALVAGESTQISLDNGVTWITATVSGTTWSVDNTSNTLPDGTYTVQARVVDTAGNIGATDSQEVIVDTVAPSPATTIDITAIADD